MTALVPLDLPGDVAEHGGHAHSLLEPFLGLGALAIVLAVLLTASILLLVARGMTNAEIARTLVLTEATVKTHVRRVLTKLGLRNRVEIVIYAYESGLNLPD